MFEYMASGTPYLASDFPLWREITRESSAGVCIDMSQPQLIAEKILDLLARPDYMAKLGESGRRASVEKYNWSSEADVLCDFYNDLYNNSRVQIVV
jgi:glycosyltransferase involved in cell wall biosynthesis